MNLNTENARAFNSSLKKALNELTGQKISVEIINSYKFPKCYVRVHAQTEFSNDLRLKCFDARGNDRSGLMDETNVSYGNIQSRYISLGVSEWLKVFNN